MKLVKCNLNELGINTYKKSKYQELLDEFLSSDMNCARVDGWTNCNSSSCSCALNKAIIRYKYHGVIAKVKKGEVYLIRTDQDE